MATAVVLQQPASLLRQRGFTYAMALVAIVLVGIFAGMANLATSRIAQADREQELLFRGQAYRNAIQHYYAVSGRYPRALSELTKDPRFAQRAYLRTLYPDPMASGEDQKRANGGWQLVRAADGGIAGVASSSRQEPLKKANFPFGYERFEQAKSYAEWIFEYAPHPGVGAGAAAASASPPIVPLR